MNGQNNIHGPYSIQDLIDLKLNKKGQPLDDKFVKYSGIYAWGVNDGKHYFPIYVGMARNITERLFQHITGFFGGIYPIPSYDKIIDRNRDIADLKKTVENTHTLPEGLVYYPLGDFGVFKGKQLINQRHRTIQKELHRIRENMFVAWMNLDPYSKEQAKQQEGNLAALIGRNKLIGTNYAKPDTKNSLIEPWKKLNFQ